MKTGAATISRRDIGEFQHKAVKALAAYGMSRGTIGETLGVSTRTVRRYQNTPCPAYDLETEREKARRAVEAVNHSAAPFLSAAEIRQLEEEARNPMRATWDAEGARRFTREEVVELHRQGLRAVDIARKLGISRQAVSKHLAVIREVSRDEYPVAA